MAQQQQPSTLTVFVHVYDHVHDQGRTAPLTVEDLQPDWLVANVTVTVSSASPATRFTPTGIILYDQLRAGSYQITVTSTGYKTNTVTYNVGPGCLSSDGSCHALVPMDKEAQAT